MMERIGPTGDWTPAQMEQAGHEVLQLIRGHLAELADLPVLPKIGAAELRELLNDPVPTDPEEFASIVQDTMTRIIPHLTLWNHPRFFAYFPVGSSGPGAMADLLASSLNINGMLWKTAPAAAALEQVVLRWMAEMVGYDQAADGVLINGASLATYYALAAAREAAGLDIRQCGMIGRDLPKLRVYCSEHAHSSIDKAVIGLGIGLDNLVKLDTDASHQLNPEQLTGAIQSDLARGYVPLATVAVVGTTSTGAVDPVKDIAAICQEHKMWLHVDGAYGGFYNIVSEIRDQVGEMHAADSIVVNPHKVLFTPLEVTALYCRRKGALADAFSLIPEYLRTDDDGDGIVNPMDFSLQLGRSFRALKVWWVIRTFGLNGLRTRMQHQLVLADQLRRLINDDPDFQTFDQLTASARRAGTLSTPYPLVCFRAFPKAWRGTGVDSKSHGAGNRRPDFVAGDRRNHRDNGTQELVPTAVDRLNESLMQHVNDDRRHFISHTVVREGYILRASIGNLRTDKEHVDTLWQSIRQNFAELPKGLDDWLPA